MDYHRAKKVLLGLLCGYFLVGVYAEAYHGGELYPVFSWRLFAVIPQTVETARIEMTTL